MPGTSSSAAPADPAAVQRRLIQRAREAKGLSQRALGACLGLAQSVISRIENGQGVIAPGLLPPLAAVLDIEGETLHALLAASGPEHRRRWIWSSPRHADEKLLLLAVLDSPDGCIDLDQLRVRTSLDAGRIHRLTEELRREGILQGVAGCDASDAWVTLGQVVPLGEPLA